jgi:poly(3-hydroxybutyrate) depolymerase
MLYSIYEAGYYATTPLRFAARLSRDFWGSPLNPAADSELGRRLYAGADLFANLTKRYGKPDWGVDTVKIGQVEVRVRPTVVWESPWAKMIQFDRDMADMRRAGRFAAWSPPC